MVSKGCSTNDVSVQQLDESQHLSMSRAENIGVSELHYGTYCIHSQPIRGSLKESYWYFRHPLRQHNFRSTLMNISVRKNMF